MENRLPDPLPSSAARDQLRVARQAHDASARRATAPARFILALSLFCGAQTVAPGDKGPGNVISILAAGWFLAELVWMSARNQWRPLQSLPKPRWGVMEGALIAVAIVVGGVIGPHLLADHGRSAAASWGLGAAVAVVVAACLFGAKAIYLRRASRGWQR